MAFQVCTIITRSYLPQARVLYRSFRQFHPDTKFNVLVFDAAADELDEPFNVLRLGDIGLPAGEETRMPMLYNVTELATALKPWFFRHLLSQEQTPLLYFDPDIEIFSSVERLAQLASQHCLVLTPHTTSPMTRDDVRPNETDILNAGAYNLGFLGLNYDCEPFLDWWSERLLREAVIDVANMRFTDQRWMDFAPGYFDTYIVKDDTCNIAYWNADSRPLNWNGQRYEVNRRPLCFFHFSGFRPEDPHLLSLHQSTNPRTRLSEHPALARLCGEYAKKLADAGYDKLQALPYRWDTAPGGLTITKPMRFAYRVALGDHEQRDGIAPPSPFADAAAFINWLNEPAHGRLQPEITRYFQAIHASRPDVRAVFPKVPGADAAPYYQWLRDHGCREIPIPDKLFPVVPPKSRAIMPNGGSGPPHGITLTGYLRAEAGTGEAARLISLALQASGEKQTTQVWTNAPSRQKHPWEDDCVMAHHYDTNLICINADQLPGFANEVGPEFFHDRHNIGLWFWEAEVFPPTMHRAFDYLHEIWVASAFVRQALAKQSPIPVYTIPLPLNLTPSAMSPAATRAALNLPDRFLFLFSFDFFSVAERKNPAGVIEAFKRAFVPNEGPVLLIKSINGNRNLAELERLRYLRGDRTDIIIHDGYLSAAERDQLIAACDCYVSLHRSEGFGLTLAEAMLLEKPTIGTRYSGNLEFMTDSNSFLCGYALRRIGAGCPPYPSTAQWADPNLDEAAELMQFVHRNPAEAKSRASRGRRDLCANHNPQIAAEFIKTRLAELRQKPPMAVPFTAPAWEKPIFTRLRTTIARGVDVRRTVPSLLTWIFQGPRRAMKQFLRAYDQHHRTLGVSTVDTMRELDAERLRDQASLTERIATQENELDLIRKELKEARRRLAAVEDEVQARKTSAEETDETPQTAESNVLRFKSGSA